MPKRSGFTLIELLVVMAIIGVLSTVGLTMYNNSLAVVRDGKRQQDLKSLTQALEVYSLSHDGQYIKEVAGSPADSCVSANIDKFYGEIAPFMANQIVPTDPFSNQANEIKYCYVPLNNGASFRLFAKLEKCDFSNLPECVTGAYNYTLTSADLTPTAVAILPSGSPSPPPGGGSGGSPPPGGATASPSPTPVPVVAQCSLGITVGQTYPDTSMIGCDARTTLPLSSTLCAASSHVCSVDEYSARGGQTIMPNRGRWLGTTGGESVILCNDSTLAFNGTNTDVGYWTGLVKNHYENCSSPLLYISADNKLGILSGVMCCK